MSPVEIFGAFFDNDVFQLIVDESSRYAFQTNNHRIKHFLALSSSQDITRYRENDCIGAKEKIVEWNWLNNFFPRSLLSTQKCSSFCKQKISKLHHFMRSSMKTSNNSEYMMNICQ